MPRKAKKILVVETYIREILVEPDKEDDDFEFDAREFVAELYGSDPSDHAPEAAGKKTFTSWEFRSAQDITLPAPLACYCNSGYVTSMLEGLLCPMCQGIGVQLI